jgi:hypothetical protein
MSIETIIIVATIALGCAIVSVVLSSAGERARQRPG